MRIIWQSLRGVRDFTRPNMVRSAFFFLLGCQTALRTVRESFNSYGSPTNSEITTWTIAYHILNYEFFLKDRNSLMPFKNISRSTMVSLFWCSFLWCTQIFFDWLQPSAWWTSLESRLKFFSVSNMMHLCWDFTTDYTTQTSITTS